MKERIRTAVLTGMAVGMTGSLLVLSGEGKPVRSEHTESKILSKIETVTPTEGPTTDESIALTKMAVIYQGTPYERAFTP